MAHRYRGVLAPNSHPRAAVVALGRELTDDPSAPTEGTAPARNAGSPTRYF